MHGCIPFPRNNLWFGEYGCLPVLLTNQQPIRFFQLSFPLSYCLPGTRRVGAFIIEPGYKGSQLFLISKTFIINFYIFNRNTKNATFGKNENKNNFNNSKSGLVRHCIHTFPSLFKNAAEMDAKMFLV